MGAAQHNFDVIVAVVAVMLIVYIWLSSMIYIFRPWFVATKERYSGYWIAYFVVLHVDVVMIFWSYFSVTLTTPGLLSPAFPSQLIQVWEYLGV